MFVWPVLTPLTSGTARTSRLRLTIVRSMRAAAQRRPRQVGHRAEERVAAQDERELDQVLGARVVAQRVEADGVGVVRVGQPELARAAVHERDEAAVGPADARGQRGRRVVGAGQQQPAQQVGHRHALAPAQADDRLDGQCVVGHRGEDLGELRALERDQRGHELGRRGDRPLAARLALEDDVARGRLDEDRRGRPDRRAARRARSPAARAPAASTSRERGSEHASPPRGRRARVTARA